MKIFLHSQVLSTAPAYIPPALFLNFYYRSDPYPQEFRPSRVQNIKSELNIKICIFDWAQLKNNLTTNLVAAPARVTPNKTLVTTRFFSVAGLPFSYKLGRRHNFCCGGLISNPRRVSDFPLQLNYPSVTNWDVVTTFIVWV